jgi:DNA-binding beta-propeller fold protein YncE
MAAPGDVLVVDNGGRLDEACVGDLVALEAQAAGVEGMADSGNHEVRKVSAAGVITRVAGTGTPGDTGDDGPATGAQLNRPFGVAVTPDGGFLIADTFNNMVRQVSAAGVITRVAGTGIPGNTGDDGPATDAQLHEPAGMAATPDGGFLIADVLNNEVRKMSAD